RRRRWCWSRPRGYGRARSRPAALPWPCRPRSRPCRGCAGAPARWEAWCRSSAGRTRGMPVRLRQLRSVLSFHFLLGVKRKSIGARRCRGMDHFGLVDGGTADFLLEARPLALRERRQAHGLAVRRGTVEGADDAHVGEALVGAGLGRAVLQDAVGKVEQLGRELVALGEAPLAHLALERQAVAQRARIVVGRLDREVALGAGEPVLGHLGRAEAGGERG